MIQNRFFFVKKRFFLEKMQYSVRKSDCMDKRDFFAGKGVIMDDTGIIELFFSRDESALKELQQKYGAYASKIALNLLRDKGDAQECVNDAYLTVWDSIPPQRPASLRVYLGRIVRNISVSRYRQMHAQKRFDGVEVALAELEDVLPSSESVERTVDGNLLREHLNEWLMSIPGEDRMLFVRRYWYGDRTYELAKKCGVSDSTMSRRLTRLREDLRGFLAGKGEIV